MPSMKPHINWNKKTAKIRRDYHRRIEKEWKTQAEFSIPRTGAKDKCQRCGHRRESHSVLYSRRPRIIKCGVVLGPKSGICPCYKFREKDAKKSGRLKTFNLLEARAIMERDSPKPVMGLDEFATAVRRPGMNLIKSFDKGERVVSMATWKGVVVIATERAVYACGDERKIRKIFAVPEPEKAKASHYHVNRQWTEPGMTHPLDVQN